MKRSRNSLNNDSAKVADKCGSKSAKNEQNRKSSSSSSSSKDVMNTSNKKNKQAKGKEQNKKNSSNDKVNATKQGKDEEISAAAASLAGLDSLFESAKQEVKRVRVEREAAQDLERSKAKAAKELLKRQKAEAAVNNAKPVRFDAELGLPIYREEDLRIGQGGGTAACPFDCSCCF